MNTFMLGKMLIKFLFMIFLLNQFTNITNTSLANMNFFQLNLLLVNSDMLLNAGFAGVTILSMQVDNSITIY